MLNKRAKHSHNPNYSFWYINRSYLYIVYFECSIWMQFQDHKVREIEKYWETVHFKKEIEIWMQLYFAFCDVLNAFSKVAKISRHETTHLNLKKKSALYALWEFLTGETETLKPILSPWCIKGAPSTDTIIHLLILTVHFGTIKLCTYRLRCEKFPVKWKRWAAECNSWAVDCRDAVPARCESHRGRNIMHTFSPSLNHTGILS